MRMCQPCLFTVQLLISSLFGVPATPKVSTASFFALAVVHVHGWEGGRNFGRLLICNCGGWSTNCTLGECLRANDGLAWGRVFGNWIALWLLKNQVDRKSWSLWMQHLIGVYTLRPFKKAGPQKESNRQSIFRVYVRYVSFREGSFASPCTSGKYLQI